MNKKMGALTLTTAMLTGLAACGGGGENTDNEGTDMEEQNGDENSGSGENDTEEQSENGSSSENWYEDLDFQSIDVNADYADGEYQAEYEYNDGNPEADIDDSRGGEDIEMEGQEALDELSSILPEMNIEESSSEEEVQQAAVEAFSLDDNYDELEVDVEFPNDEETEVEQKS